MKKTNRLKKQKLTARNNKPGYFGYLAILALVVISIYAKTNRFGFVNIDDGKLIYENPLVTSDAVPYSECFNSLIYNVHYKPLVFISWKAEYQLFGANPSHFHLINWLLHLANTLLLFFIALHFFRKLYMDEKKIIFSSFLLALLFSVNPLRLESVAWSTERKDVLFAFFFLSGWLTYLYFLQNKKIMLLVISGILYLFSGLSKSMGITLIAILFLTDLWFNRKVNFKLILEKIPFLIVFLVLAFFYGLIDFGSGSGSDALADITIETVDVKQVSSLEMINNLPHILQLILSASIRFILWIVHLLVPVKLSVIYPHDAIFKSLGFSIYIFPFIVLSVFLLGWFYRKRTITFLAGMLFFAITISPALAVGSSGSAIFLSDRYTYIPSIGIIFIMIYYINQLKNTKLNYWIFGGIFLFYFITSFTMVNKWENSEKLFNQALKIYPDSGLAHLNLGKYYREQNEINKAMEVYNKGIKLAPGYYPLYSNRGRIFFDQGQIDQSLNDYNKCLSLAPNYYVALTNRGAALGTKKEWDAAIADLTRALEIRPRYELALSNRGLIYYNLGEYDKTITDYTRYLELDPNNPDIMNTLGLCYRVKKENEKALELFNRAVQLNPNQGVFFLNRSYTLNALGNKEEALKDALNARNKGTNVNENYIEFLKQ